jgi:parallel beta-helix repeat protein
MNTNSVTRFRGLVFALAILALLATFRAPAWGQSPNLTVAEVGQGTVISTQPDSQIDCVNSSGTCNATYSSGTLVTLQATAAAGYVFSGWSACFGANSCTVAVNQPLTVTANFTQCSTGCAQASETRTFGYGVSASSTSATESMSAGTSLSGVLGTPLTLFNTGSSTLNSPTIAISTGLPASDFPGDAIPVGISAPSLSPNGQLNSFYNLSNPVGFTPGFDSSRSVSPLVIPPYEPTQQDTLQTVIVTVTPRDSRYFTPGGLPTSIGLQFGNLVAGPGPSGNSTPNVQFVSLVSIFPPSNLTPGVENWANGGPNTWFLYNPVQNKTYIFTMVFQVHNPNSFPVNGKTSLDVNMTVYYQSTPSFGNEVTITDNTCLNGSSTCLDGSITYSAISSSGGSSIGWTAIQQDSYNMAYWPSLISESDTTSVTSNLNPSNVGDAVTFTATVNPSNGGTGTPTGSVTFNDGTSLLGTGTLVNGVATWSTSTLTAGSHSITAVYSGDTNFSGSTSPPLTQNVRTTTTLTLTSLPNPSVSGQTVTLTATLAWSGPGTPTGNIGFMGPTGSVGGASLNSQGYATVTTSTLGLGSNSITATYNGDANFSGSTSAVLVQHVNKAQSSTTLVSSANPAVYRQTIIFTATVTGSNPTGNVTFSGPGFTSGPIGLSSGQASYTLTSSSNPLTPPSSTITAAYSGDGSNAVSSGSISQIVNAANTTTALTSSSPNPSAYGQAVTFTVSIRGVAPSGAMPTGGTVSFFDNGTPIPGSASSPTNGTATFTYSGLSAGSHSITAQYVDGTNLNNSTSPPLTQTVNTATGPATCNLLVTKTADDGSTGTLRQAIQCANNYSSVNTITFYIPESGVQTITPQSPLPTITAPMIINGYSQPGASANTSASGDNAVLLIELNGSAVNNSALTITGSGSTVQGLAINRATGFGIVLQGSGANGNTIQGNFLGTDPTGKIARPNTFNGLRVEGSNNTIGGSTPAASNLISGNGNFGIVIDNTLCPPNNTACGTAPSGNLVQGNLIGTDATGAEGPKGTASNQGIAGVDLSDGASGNTVTGNVIAFNSAQGVRTDAPNSSTLGPHHNSISGNAIFSNSKAGVAITAGSGNTISQNSIYGNGSNSPLSANGIILDSKIYANQSCGSTSGPNHWQNFPVLTSISSSSITGTFNSLPSTSFTLEFFASDTGDPIGFGEGKTFLGSTQVTTDATCNASFTFTPQSAIASGQAVTATATNMATGDTSQFSNWGNTVTVVSTINPSTFGQQVTITATVTLGSSSQPVPQGSVTFMEGANVLSGPTPVGSSGQASFSTSSLAAGSHTITAQYTDTTVPPTATPATASVTLLVNPAAATVTLGNLTQTYTGNAMTPTATTVPSGLSITWTGAPQTNAGSYPVTATIGNGNYQGTASGTFTINPATATVTLSNLTQTYTGNAMTPTATTVPTGLSITWTGAPQTNAGSYPVTATINNGNYQGSATGTFTINPATATVTLSNLTQTYTGSALTPTATTNPGGLSIIWTGAPQTNAGSYPVTASIGNSNYQGSASGTFTINKAAPVISWAAPSPIIYGAALSAAQLNATASIPGTFTYTPPAGTVLNAGNGQALSVTFTPNDSTDYTIASTSVPINVSKAIATISLTGLLQAYDGAPEPVTATVTAVTPLCAPASVTYNGSSMAPTNIGSYAVSASIVNPNCAGSTVSGTLIIFAYAAPSANFVIGDLSAARSPVTFWDAQWGKLNSFLNGSTAPASFKGFAEQVSSTPARCGGTWTSDTGNSSGPPATIPAYMAVVVSSSITQTGSTIAGNISQIVIVQTNPGYAPNPGHAGTGTVVAHLCP